MSDDEEPFIATGKVFDDPVKQKQFEADYARAILESQPYFDPLADCQRLTAADYAVTINAR